ncbi:MAG: Queuosine precursor transporter QueT [Firmicutes bacterium ADurb.Bin193]|nr:MAG: Queuosine precursor transporter QueT [Firmicutes bacterium ADurb.Bin193]
MLKPKFIAHSAVIAAAYAVLTLSLPMWSYGPVQVRAAEAFTLLAGFTPAAIPGLYIGCLVSNIYTGNITDIIFGSLTTLVAAFLSYKLRKKPWLVPLPPVILNALIVGFYLTYQYGGLMYINMLTVGAGQLIACYVIPCYFIINFKKFSERIRPYIQY